MEKNTTEDPRSITEWIFLFLGLLILILLNLTILKKEPYVTTRKAVAKEYGIDLKTLNKWIQLLADQNILPYVLFTKQRGLTQRQYDYLIELFGSPTESKKKYSKFDIVASVYGIGQNDYRDVRKSIEQWPKKCIVSREIYAHLNFFLLGLGVN